MNGAISTPDPTSGGQSTAAASGTEKEAAAEPSLQFLRHRLAGASLRRGGQALGLWGEAGIGKTHTATAALRDLACRSLSLHACTPLDDLARQLPRGARLPLWAGQVLDRTQAGQPPAGVGALLDALSATLAALAPFVLHLEDLHEADQERLDLITGLAALVSRTRGVGLLVTSRSLPPAPFEARHHDPLDDRASALLLEREAAAPLPAGALGWIHGRAAGNPLFTLEYFRLLARQGHLWNDSRQWRWRAPEGDPMPVTVEALVERALSDVIGAPNADGPLGRAAAAMALLPGADAGTLSAVAGLDPAALTAAQHELERQGVLLRGDFAHLLYREMTAQRLGEEAQQELARRAIRALEADPERTASFVERAVLPPAEARRRLEAAASAAQAGGRTAQAARWLAQAADLAGGDLAESDLAGSAQEQARLALRAARALETVQPSEALRMARLAARLRPGDPETALYLAGRLVQHNRRLSDADEVLRPFAPSVRLGPDWIAWQIAWMMRSGQYAPALGLWESHPDLAARPSADTLYSVAVCLAQTGRFQEAAEVARRGLELPDTEPAQQASLLNVSSMACAFMGQPQAAEAHLSAALALARAHGMHQLLGALLQNRAKNLERTDRFADALAAAQEALQAYADAGDTLRHANAGALVSAHLGGFGRCQEAETLLLDSVALLERQGSSRFLVVAQLTLAVLYLDWQQGDWQPPHGGVLALKLARSALGHLRALGLWEPGEPQATPPGLAVFALAALARAEAACGDARAALQHAGEAVAALGDAGQTSAAQTSAAQSPDESAVAAFLALAAACSASGQTEQARHALGRALAAAQARGFTLEARRIELEVARLEGDPEGAAAQHDWFRSQGLLGGMWLARRYFPELALREGGETGSPAGGPPPRHAEAAKPQTTRPRLDVLGPMKCAAGSEGGAEAQALPVRGRKRRELLATLLEARLRGHAEVSRLDLLDALYPGSGEVQASASLKELVHLTRAALGPGVIQTTTGGYALAEIDSDAARFLKSGDTRLWRGPYLQDALPAQHDESVTEALHLTLHTRIGASLGAEPQEAARVARLLQDAEPYNLEALRLLLASLRACGNHRSLQRRYQEARLRLSEVGEALPDHWAEFMKAQESRAAGKTEGPAA